ncbi:MAG TPA: prephenate dehydratase [Saprospiraceae bacterium]|nr:prephenate dehydratase [Saprospiraceae bacterium]HNT18811.1 prephenate dehydratase [Saprospiraceae bacterium]
MTKLNTDQTKPETLRVAIQGYRGAFHDIAVQRYFKGHPLEVAETETFEEIVQLVEKKQVDFGAMAIENTIYGMLMPNYNLLNKARVSIHGEVYLRIQQNLIAWPGQKPEDLKEVHSHPIAIEQCREYFKAWPHIKLIESVDTAWSVREVKEKKLKSRGAIGSTLAAQLYGLEILVPSIETNKKNFTRFLIIERKGSSNPLPHSNKASVIFSLTHEVGSLHQVLSILASQEANLTKIQSIPILGKPFEYAFWVDLTADHMQKLLTAIDSIAPMIHDLKVLGIYPKGAHYDH